jgi:hypothetical protein
MMPELFGISFIFWQLMVIITLSGYIVVRHEMKR